MREPEGYRDELMQLNQHFPDKAVLNRQDIMDYTGKKRYWMDSHGFKGLKSFTKQQAARILVAVR